MTDRPKAEDVAWQINDAWADLQDGTLTQVAERIVRRALWQAETNALERAAEIASGLTCRPEKDCKHTECEVLSDAEARILEEIQQERK